MQGPRGLIDRKAGTRSRGRQGVAVPRDSPQYWVLGEHEDSSPHGCEKGIKDNSWWSHLHVPGLFPDLQPSASHPQLLHAGSDILIKHRLSANK